jgi:hypothetical protein
MRALAAAQGAALNQVLRAQGWGRVGGGPRHGGLGGSPGEGDGEGASNHGGAQGWTLPFLRCGGDSLSLPW